MTADKPVSNHSFNEVNKEFLKQIESLREVLPLVMIFITANDDKANKDFIKYTKDFGKKEVDPDGESYYTFSPELAHNVSALRKNAEIASTATDIIPTSLFVSLISQYDSFLGKLIKAILNVVPQILNSSEKTLTFSKLLDLKSIEEAKEIIVEKEVEAILRESHSSHFDWLEEKLSIPLRKQLPIWQTFIEITERRNLYVHCNGVISSQYISVCNKHKVPLESETKVGMELDVSPEYFETAFKCLFEISTKLTQVIWRKLIPIDLESADDSLNDICFELIKNGQYSLADKLLEFATSSLPRHFSEETKNVFVVNQALSLKLGGNSVKSEEILKSKDWSATSSKFKIAKEILLENFDAASKLMRKIGANGEITKLNYKSWPLFIEFRKTQIFTETYEDLFDEEYRSVETPKKLLDQVIAQVESNKKQKNNLTISSFLDVTKDFFPTYQFILYRAESFLITVLQMHTLSKIQFESALKSNMEIVKDFNNHIIKDAPANYLNPYTMIRHCLYLSNKNHYKSLLFTAQQNKFEGWLSSR